MPLNQVPFPSQPDSLNLLQPDSPVVFTAGFVYITSSLSLAEPGLERKRGDWCNNGHLQHPSAAGQLHVSETSRRLQPLAGPTMSGLNVTFASGQQECVKDGDGERHLSRMAASFCYPVNPPTKYILKKKDTLNERLIIVLWGSGQTGSRRRSSFSKCLGHLCHHGFLGVTNEQVQFNL